MGTRALDDLSSDFQPKVMVGLARLTERGLAVQIVQTGRTMAEHQANVANGTSRATLSKHLPRVLRGFPSTDPNAQKSDAIDICPYSVYMVHGDKKLDWDPNDPAWLVIGEVGEALGFRWGGRWHDPHDPGHWELDPVPVPPATVSA